jgi:hypothetical protein
MRNSFPPSSSVSVLQPLVWQRLLAAAAWSVTPCQAPYFSMPPASLLTVKKSGLQGRWESQTCSIRPCRWRSFQAALHIILRTSPLSHHNLLSAPQRATPTALGRDRKPSLRNLPPTRQPARRRDQIQPLPPTRLRGDGESRPCACNFPCCNYEMAGAAERVHRP